MSPRLKLAPYFDLHYRGNQFSVGAGSRAMTVTDLSLATHVARLAALFAQGPHSPEEAKTAFVRDADSETHFTTAFSILSHLKALIPETVDVSGRYSRNHIAYLLEGGDVEEIQRRLGRASVLLLGCGGVGTGVAAQLAGAGVGRLILCDPDTIELTNLNRQFLYRERDIGSPKAVTLAAALRERNSSIDVSIESAPQTLHDLSELKVNADVVVVAGDVPELVDNVNLWAVKRKQAWIATGYSGEVAKWGPLFTPGNGCFRCGTAPDLSVPPDLRDSVATIKENMIAPSSGPVNGICASAVVMDLLRYLGGFSTPLSLGHMARLRMTDFSLSRTPWPKDTSCVVCGSVGH